LIDSIFESLQCDLIMAPLLFSATGANLYRLRRPAALTLCGFPHIY